MSDIDGGVRRGSVYEGRLAFEFNVDLKKLLGWSGASFRASAYQIHGRSLSRHYVRNLHVASGIEALPSTRLFELWTEQKLFGGQLAIRGGQLSADTEFLVSQYATLFMNSTFGWPAIVAADLPSGGPVYPLATPGARLKITPNDQVSGLIAVFNGDPAGEGRNDPEQRNRHGTNFRVSDPAFVIAEAAYTYNQGTEGNGLPGAVKIGGWHHFGRFNDLRFSEEHHSLADPNSSSLARQLHGDSGIYAVLDQTLFRVKGTADQGIGVFVRASGSPSDRNLINFYANSGLIFKGVLPTREDDSFGIGLGYSRISDRARGFDRDAALFTQTRPVIRNSEALFEATYEAQIIPGWTVKPDIQYVIRPGGHIPDPLDPIRGAIKNAVIAGIRTTVKY